MALLSPTEKAMCNQLVQKWDSVIAPLNEARRSFRDQMSAFELALRNATWSIDISDVQQGLNDLTDAANDIIPGADTQALEDLKNFMDNCDLFKDNNPVSNLLGSVIGFFDELDGLIADISITVPEFGLGFLADALNKILNGFKFPGGAFLIDLFRLLDIIIGCLDALCGITYHPEMDEFKDELDRLMSYEHGFNITDNYLFNFKKIYDDLIVDGYDIQEDKLNIAIDGIGDTKNNALAAVDESTDAVKAAMKIGELF